MIRLRFLHTLSGDQIDQITDLYRRAGWWNDPHDDPDLVARLVAGSHCFLTAQQDGRIVGMGRAISDGASDAYIQDVTVRADLRGRGTASQIVQALVDRLLQDGVHWIGLIAEKGSTGIYGRLGFGVMAEARPMRYGEPCD